MRLVRHFRVVLAVLVLAGGAGAAPAGADQEPDVVAGECTPSTIFNARAITRSQHLGVVFTSTASGPVTGFRAALGRRNPDAPLVVSIASWDGTAPGPALGTATIEPLALPPVLFGQPLSAFTFAGDPVLAAGEQYALTFQTDAADWYVIATGPDCADDVSLARSSGAAWRQTVGGTHYEVTVRPEPDTDSDGTADRIDTDDDGDGVDDGADAFPLDATETADLDGDGVGDNADTDDDGDGVDDSDDAFPLDATETADLDGDGVGNNADTDDDGDGVDDSDDAFPLDPSRDGDEDNDGVADTAPPTSKDQCKADGWRGFNNPSFRNQGQCVSYVTTRR